MNFKEWFLAQEGRFKGLKRMFDKEYSDLPKYVRDDLYNTRIGYTMNRLLGNPALQPTVGIAIKGTGSSGYSRNTDSDIPSNVASRIFNAAAFKDFKFGKQPVLIQVGPLDFNEQCLGIMMDRLFGFRPDERIRDDAFRMNKQRELLGDSGNNEPVIMLKDGDKYKLLEGWHRTMSSLVFDGNDAIGAPPQHIVILKQGKSLPADELKQWKKVPLKAYIGVPKQLAV